MPSPYDADAFSTRVDFAAKRISEGGNHTRHFDTCFEMWDGDAVAVALYRRARRNPKLKRNLFKYLNRSSVIQAAWLHRRRKTRDLKILSQELRAKKQAESDAFHAQQRAKRDGKQ